MNSDNECMYFKHTTHLLQKADKYGGVEGPPHIFFDIMLSHTDDIVTRP